MLGLLLAASVAVCPDAPSGETVQDCPYAGAARELARAQDEGRPLGPLLEELLPGISRQLKADCAQEGLKGLWGESVNFDELAKSTIVPEGVLAALEAAFEAPPTREPGRLAHAGLEHTYGYLLSTVKTPFGFKRARWVSGGLERGLGLPPGTLGPAPAEGTLFANATMLAGRIALQDDGPSLAALKAAEGAAARALAVYDYAALDVTRLEERAAGATLRTDIVRLPHPAGPDTHLLVYSAAESPAGRPRLITMFPIAEAFAKRLGDPAGAGPCAVKARYNASVKRLGSGETRGVCVLKARR
ncbi:MAG: hypothetical protein HYV15_04645 [Elusimicrobia bacterium]|nr:hypothetical protein [Elusimicrobiota bacterium]